MKATTDQAPEAQANEAMDIAIALGVPRKVREQWLLRGAISATWRARILVEAGQRKRRIPLSIMETLPPGTSVEGTSPKRGPGRPRKVVAP